ncbi:MAG: acido-empty-quinoprotein group A, partial [Acidobacteriaceae bacterium]
MRIKFLVSVLLLAAGATAWAQGVDHSMLLNPPADSWPSYHGTYDGRRHSKLDQITPGNVSSLTLEWAFQTNQRADIKASPLMVDGVIYFSVPDNVWA